MHSTLVFSDQAVALKSSDFYIVAVPTPIDAAPNLGAILSASKTVGGALKRGDPRGTGWNCKSFIDNAASMTSV
jgi:UDP-N-acetyl-D-mannosaminuronate dehydrogenase